jgi:hypothetical protein
MLADRELARWRRRPRARLALAGAFSTVLLIALAAVGGLGYAATAVNSATHAATRVLEPNKPQVVDQNAATDQYGKKVPMCHKGKTIYVAEDAVPARLRQGDTLGPGTMLCHSGKTIVVRARTTEILRKKVRARLRRGDKRGRCASRRR